MNRFNTLPKYMVAPNGARKDKNDHPNLPSTIEEIVNESKNCFLKGANGIHAHVRDKNGKHVLDSGLYKELIKELAKNIPQLPVQITTEAVGIYSPKDQIQIVKDVMPESASVALSEMIPNDKDTDLASKFYYWSLENDVHIQHILYSPKDFLKLAQYIKLKVIPNDNLQVLFVLGRYSLDFESKISDLDPFMMVQKKFFENIDWGVCAFGKEETDCLLRALAIGGKARIGFENNFYNRDGSLAKNNAERVDEIVKLNKNINL